MAGRLIRQHQRLQRGHTEMAKMTTMHCLLVLIVVGALRSAHPQAVSPKQQPAVTQSPATKSLIEAVKRSDLPAVKAWLAKGADPNGREIEVTKPSLETNDPGGKAYFTSTDI